MKKKNTIVLVCLLFLLVYHANDMNFHSNVVETVIHSPKDVKCVTVTFDSCLFRGVYWPNKVNQGNFRLWCLDVGNNPFTREREKFFNVPAPDDFTEHTKDVSDSWIFKEIFLSCNKWAGGQEFITYEGQSKIINKKVTFSIPIKKRNYRFSVLESNKGQNLIIISDSGQNIRDYLFFSYLLLQ